jgi:uncharacterized membrane protein YGL010W
MSFWAEPFAFYLAEHRDPRNRATHYVGIPVLAISAIVGIVTWNLWIFLGGQVVGWAFQLWGHRIEGNRPALLKRPTAWILGPIMVLVALLDAVGVRLAFVEEARRRGA